MLETIIIILLIVRIIQAHYQHQELVRLINNFATMVGDLADKE